MKRAGFTMIELIFVIVILGILAAVAIPKLAATRNDATASTMATSASTCITEQAGKYMKDGNFSNPIASSSGSCTDATAAKPTACFSFAGANTTGVLTVTTLVTGSAASTDVCGKATFLLNKNGLVALTANGTKDHQF